MKKKVFKLSKSSKKNIKDVDSRIITLVDRILIRSEDDFGIPNYGGRRTPQEQNNLFHQIPKVTQLDGFNGISYHQSGMAWDIFVYDEHGACWTCIDKYKSIAKIAREEFEKMQDEGIFDCEDKLIWGGNWKRFKDYPHHEIRLKNNTVNHKGLQK